MAFVVAHAAPLAWRQPGIKANKAFAGFLQAIGRRRDA